MRGHRQSERLIDGLLRWVLHATAILKACGDDTIRSSPRVLYRLYAVCLRLANRSNMPERPMNSSPKEAPFASPVGGGAVCALSATMSVERLSSLMVALPSLTVTLLYATFPLDVVYNTRTYLPLYLASTAIPNTASALARIWKYTGSRQKARARGLLLCALEFTNRTHLNSPEIGRFLTNPLQIVHNSAGDGFLYLMRGVMYNKRMKQLPSPGIIEIDLHGMTKIQAQACIDAAIRRAGRGVYRIRLIHGYQHGTQLRSMVRARYRRHEKVLRLELGLNQGETELVLREY